MTKTEFTEYNSSGEKFRESNLKSSEEKSSCNHEIKVRETDKPFGFESSCTECNARIRADSGYEAAEKIKKLHDEKIGASSADVITSGKSPVTAAGNGKSEFETSDESLVTGEKLTIRGGIVYDDTQIGDISSYLESEIKQISESVDILSNTINQKDDIEGYAHIVFSLLIEEVTVNDEATESAERVLESELSERETNEHIRIFRLR